MIKVKCVQKLRDKNGVIKVYKLQDNKGVIKEMTPDKLKELIKDKKLVVSNLTLTSNNRLVDTSEKDEQAVSEKVNKLHQKN